MKPLGAHRDPEGEARGEPLERLAAVRMLPSVPVGVDLRPFVAAILEQSGSSCVGHALAQALRVRAAIQGTILDPSPMAIYAMARELETPGRMRLPDAGSYPNKALAGLNDWGVCRRTRWPDDVDPGERVPIDVLEAGVTAYITGEYRIGLDRVTEVRRALGAWHPVFFAMNVDATYMSYRGGLWPGMSGSPQGGHAQCIVGYDDLGVLVANSWGRSFGINGFAHIAWEYIDSDDCFDFQVITAAPAGVE